MPQLDSQVLQVSQILVAYWLKIAALDFTNLGLGTKRDRFILTGQWMVRTNELFMLHHREQLSIG